MKTKIILTLVAVMLMPNVGRSESETMTERCAALSSTLGISSISQKAARNFKGESLSAEAFKKADGLIVTHRKRFNASNEELTDTLTFVDLNKKVKAFGAVRYAKSAIEAQQFLLEKLAMNSLPLELLKKRYEAITGPGDLCIATRVFDKTRQEFIVNKSQIYFIRGNVVVSLWSNDKDINLNNLGVIIDHNLTASIR